MLKNKIQIYLVTYNRKQKLKETLEALLAQSSPVKDFDITILDNASTDGTSELIDDYCSKYKNLKHIRHKVNIGGNANICRAFEMGANCGKEYFWVLCDDDKYDFSNWSEVEQHIDAQDDVICVCDYFFNTNKDKTNPAYLIPQLSFVPAGIYKSCLITDDVLVNMYDAILVMFQQSVITIKCVNENKKIHVLSKPIVFNGFHFEDRVDKALLSFKRGGSENWVMERRQNTSWIVGFCNIISLLNSVKLQKECVDQAMFYRDIFSHRSDFYTYMISLFYKSPSCFWEIWSKLYLKRKVLVFLNLILPVRFKPTDKGITMTVLYKLKIRIWPRKWMKNKKKK